MKEGLNTLFGEWSKTYYTELALILTLVGTLVVSIRDRKRIPELKLLPLYLVLFLFLFIWDYSLLASGFLKNAWLSYCFWSLQYIISFLEFILFYIFIRRNMETQNMRLMFRVTPIIIAIIFIISYIISFPENSLERYLTLNWIYVFQSLPLLALCILYFLEQINRPITGSAALDNPSFWVVTGIALYTICTLPLSIVVPIMLTQDRELYNVLFSLIYVFYIILFAFVIKAYKCRPAKPK